MAPLPRTAPNQFAGFASRVQFFWKPQAPNRSILGEGKLSTCLNVTISEFELRAETSWPS